MRKFEPHMDLRLAGRWHMLTGAFARRYNAAVEIAIQGFRRCERPYVSVSGGKDSVAMAAVVDGAARSLGRDYVLWCHVSDASFPGTEEVVRELADKLQRELVMDRSPVSAFAVVGQQSARQFGKTGYFFEAIRRCVEEGGYDLAFVGVRAAESLRRTRAHRVWGPIFETTVPVWHIKCHPIARWSIEDVAATLVAQDLPIHPIYDKIPVGQRCIRLGYVTALDLLDKGTAVFLRLNYPDLYARLAASYPQVAQHT